MYGLVRPEFRANRIFFQDKSIANYQSIAGSKLHEEAIALAATR